MEQYKQLFNQQHVSPMLSINVWFIVCPIIFVIFTNTPSNNDIAAPQLDWIIHNSIIKDGATDNCNSLSLLTNKYHLSKLTTQWNLHTLHHLHNNNTPLIYSIISQYCITFEGIMPLAVCVWRIAFKWMFHFALYVQIAHSKCRVIWINVFFGLIKSV